LSLSVQQLGVRRGQDLAIEAVSFELKGGSLTALVGPNGAGKSTLLQAIAGQLPLATGSIQLDGQPLTLPMARRQLALMPQRARSPGASPSPCGT
jgi:ABC-type Mn2+/Zn2+ transport system ATPase subunit